MKEKELKKQIKDALISKESKKVIQIKVSDKQMRRIIDEKLKSFFKGLENHVKVKIINQRKSVKIENSDWLKEFPKEIEVSNFPRLEKFPEIKFPKIPKPLKEVSIKKPRWWKQISLKQTVNDIALIFDRLLAKVQKPENAIAVRLTTAHKDEFYNAIASAIAGGSFEVVGIKDSEGDRINPARHLSVNKAIEALTQDIAAAAYSATTVHANAYRFSGFFVKFSTTQSRTITISITDGTVSIPIWTKVSDVSTSRVFVPDKSWELPDDWELKVEITKTAGACLADILLITTNN
ncbi:hypothetical protein LCGC14_1220740 [marine sediment metagenome]|uniref:Uncharacterized protein n=1 Tax=marine sediment metagenome TaxID=412755 RepID=A0A0F9LBB4_9ZZZZ